MKKILLLFFILFSVIDLSAQGSSKKEILNSNFRKGSEISIGYSVIARNRVLDPSNRKNNSNYNRLNNISETFPNKTTAIGLLNLNYVYRLSKYIGLGAMASYTQKNIYFNSVIDKSFVEQLDARSLSLLAELRVFWHDSKDGVSKFYSSVAFGGAVVNTNSELNIRGTRFRYKILLLGMQVGRKKLFAFCELGIMEAGVINMGLGYRFGKHFNK